MCLRIERLLLLSMVVTSVSAIQWTVEDFHCNDGSALNLTSLITTTENNSYALLAVQEDRLDSDKLLALFGGSLLQINKQTNSHRIYRLSSDLNSGTHLAFDFVQSNGSTTVIAADFCLIVFSRNESDCTEWYRIGNCDADPWADPELMDGDFSVARFGGIINIELLEDNIVFMADIGSVRKVDFIHRRVDTYRLVPNLEDMSINGGFVYTLRSGPSGQEITIFSQNTTIAMHTCPSDAPCAEKGVFHKFSAVSPEILLGIPYGGKSLVLWNLETNAKRPLCEPGVCSVKYLMDMSAVGTTIYIGSVWQAKDGGGLYDVTFTGDCDQLRLNEMYVQFPYTIIYLDGDKVGIGCHYGSHNVSHSAPNSIYISCSNNGTWSGVDRITTLECRDNKTDIHLSLTTQEPPATSRYPTTLMQHTAGDSVAEQTTNTPTGNDGRLTGQTSTEVKLVEETSAETPMIDGTITAGVTTDTEIARPHSLNIFKTTTGPAAKDRTTTGILAAADGTMADGATADRTTADGTTADGTTAGDTTADRTTIASETADSSTADDTTADRTTADGTTADRTTAGSETADSSTTDGTTADRITAGSTTADRTSADGTTADRTLADGTAWRSTRGTTMSKKTATEKLIRDNEMMDTTSRVSKATADEISDGEVIDSITTDQGTVDRTPETTTYTRVSTVESNAPSSDSANVTTSAPGIASSNSNTQAPELSVSTADICADNLPAADGPRLGCVTMTNYSDSAFMPWVVAVITIVSIIALISIIAYVIYRRRRKRRDHADSSMHLHPLSE